jgi:TolA-binding protein
MNLFGIQKKSILIAAVTVVVIVAAIVLSCVFCKTDSTKASEKLSDAYLLFARGDKSTGNVFIRQIIEMYPKTSAAYQARLIEADMLVEQQKFDDALKLLSETVSGGEPLVIRPLAAARIIYVYDLKKDFYSAINAASNFISNFQDSFLIKDIYLNLAEYYIAVGAKDSAIKTLQELLEKFPATKEAEKAQDRINELV